MKESIISRTIVSNQASGLYFDPDKRAIASFVLVLPAAISSAETAEKYIRKNPALLPGKLVTVENVERCEKLVGMTITDFVSNAKSADARSKETRGAISKTVISGKADALYMNAAHEIKTQTVFFPASVTNIDAYIRKNVTFPGTFITAENIGTVEQLYYMDESTFISLAKPMKNKFTLA